jgi:glycosyltransferase involved in cell wall biosynthesis
VVIPTYYRDDIRKAVDSALKQTYEPVEIIVVDDSGEGAAKEWIQEDDAVELCCLDSNVGSNLARQHGFKRANGAYVQFLDDDDVLKPTKIAECIEVFSEQPSLSVVHTGVEFRGECHYPKAGIKGDVLETALRFDMWPCMTSSMLIDREAIENSEVFKNTSGADDLQMMIELAAEGTFGYVDDILVKKGDPPNTKGGSKGAVDGRFEILEQYKDLYESLPSSVYGSARADAEFHRAKYYLDERLWSFTAVLSMVRHCYWTPIETSRCGLKIAAALLGRPGWRLANGVQNAIRARGSSDE